MPLVKIKTQLPHIYKIDLNNSGLAQECAVVSTDKFGNNYYIELAILDEIDKRRLAKIIQHRFINQLPLWDIMSQTKLKNGVNALDYFQQLVKAITPDGSTFTPRAGSSGYSVNQRMEINAQNAKTRDTHSKEIHDAEELAKAKELIAKQTK